MGKHTSLLPYNIQKNPCRSFNFIQCCTRRIQFNNKMQTIAEAFLCVAHRMCCTQQLSKPFNLKIYTILNCNARALFVFYCFFSLLFLFFLTSISRTFAEWRKWKKNLWLHFVLDLPSCKEKSLFNNIASFLFLLLLSIEWKNNALERFLFAFLSFLELNALLKSLYTLFFVAIHFSFL